MDKIRLEVIGISYSQSQSGAYALILGETSGKRRLPIIIGAFEAQSIAIELEKMKPARPLTHDLFRNFAHAFKISLREVVINKFEEGVFFAQLVCFSQDKELILDARTSDAVALAVRFDCPVFTYEEILAEAGVEIDDDQTKETEGEETIELEKEEKKTKKEDLESYSLEELNELLKNAVDEEDYERASIIRDEIQRRSED